MGVETWGFCVVVGPEVGRWRGQNGWCQEVVGEEVSAAGACEEVAPRLSLLEIRILHSLLAGSAMDRCMLLLNLAAVPKEVRQFLKARRIVKRPGDHQDWSTSPWLVPELSVCANSVAVQAIETAEGAIKLAACKTRGKVMFGVIFTCVMVTGVVTEEEHE